MLEQVVEFTLDLGVIYEIVWLEYPGMFALACDDGLHFMKLCSDNKKEWHVEWVETKGTEHL